MLSKSLKVLFIGLVLLLSNSSFAQTQDTPGKTSNPDKATFIKDELKLSDAQVDQFNALFNEYTVALKEIRMEKSLEPDTRNKKMGMAKEAFYKGLKTFLSEDQFSKYLKAYDGSVKSTERRKKVD